MVMLKVGPKSRKLSLAQESLVGLKKSWVVHLPLNCNKIQLCPASLF